MASAPQTSRTGRALWLAVGRTVSALAGLVGFAVLSRSLPDAEYGCYRQALHWHSIFAPLVLIGLPETLYYVLARRPTQTRAVIAENQALLWVNAAIFALFLAAGGNYLLSAWQSDPAPGLKQALLWIAPYALLTTTIEPLAPALVSLRRASQQAIWQMLARALALAGCIAPSLLFDDDRGVAAIVGLTAAAAVAFFPGMVQLWRLGDGSRSPTWSGMFAQLRQALPLGLSTVVAGFYFGLDKLTVLRLESPEVYAWYANGAIELPVVAIVAGSTTAVLWPELAALHAEHKTAEMLQLWRRATVKLSYVLLPVFCFGMVLAEDLVTVLFSARYLESTTIFRIYLGMLLVRIAPWTVLLQAAGRSGRCLAVSCLSLAALAVVIGPTEAAFGPWGAAAAVIAVTVLVMLPGYAWLTGRLLGRSGWSLLPWLGLLQTAAWCGLAALVLLAMRWLPLAPLLRLAGGAAVFFPACYFLLTRRAGAPRFSVLEKWIGG